MTQTGLISILLLAVITLAILLLFFIPKGGIFHRNVEEHCADTLPCPKCHKIDTANCVPVMYESGLKWRRVCIACGYSGTAYTTKEQAGEQWEREYSYGIMRERQEKRKQEALENLEKEYPQFKK